MRRTLLAIVAMAAVLALAAPAVAQALEISLSESQGQCPGSAVTVTGEGDVPGDVVISFDGQAIGGGSTDAGGDFAITVDLPAASPGPHTITATVTGGDPYPVVGSDAADIGCVGAAGVILPEEGAEAAPSLAVTGGDFKVWMLLLGGLIAIGAVALIAGRRRARRA